MQDLELRKRVWRDFVTSTRSAGDPVMMALLEAEIRPQDLDSAFATICLHEDVEFPAGEAERPDPKPAWKALEKFWKELQKHLPASIDPDDTCRFRRLRASFAGSCDVSQYRLDRPSVDRVAARHVGLRVEDHPEVVGRCRRPRSSDSAI